MWEIEKQRFKEMMRKVMKEIEEEKSIYAPKREEKKKYQKDGRLVTKKEDGTFKYY